MKFKTTAIALAVAGTIAAPIAAQADGEAYASARVGIWNVDEGGMSDLEVRSFSSRFGAKGETDLGNGMTAFGRYEWDVDLNDESNTEDLSVRHRYVGLKGDFGSVTIGQTGHTWYNTVVAPWDNPWWHVGYVVVSYTNRTDNAITYAGGTDAISFGATAYFTNMDTEEDAPDGLELGASFGIGDMTLGVAIKTTEGTDADVGAAAADATEAGSIGAAETDDDIIGLALSGVSFGDVSMAFGYQMQDAGDDGDVSSLIVNVGIGNAYVHVEQGFVDPDSGDGFDPLGITLGYTQSLGRNTTMYYEFWNLDADTDDSDDDKTHVMAVMKYDIL
jgi:predicted porin